MDQETASGVAVHRRQRAVRSSHNSIRRAGDPERGTGLGESMRAEPTPGCLGDGVPGQPQRIGQGEARRHAESMDTGGIQVRQVRHGESRDERGPCWLGDETAAETEN